MLRNDKSFILCNFYKKLGKLPELRTLKRSLIIPSFSGFSA